MVSPRARQCLVGPTTKIVDFVDHLAQVAGGLGDALQRRLDRMDIFATLGDRGADLGEQSDEVKRPAQMMPAKPRKPSVQLGLISGDQHRDAALRRARGKLDAGHARRQNSVDDDESGPVGVKQPASVLGGTGAGHAIGAELLEPHRHDSADLWMTINNNDVLSRRLRRMECHCDLFVRRAVRVDAGAFAGGRQVASADFLRDRARSTGFGDTGATNGVVRRRRVKRPMRIERLRLALDPDMVCAERPQIPPPEVLATV
jgi:hypothetical protein